MNCMIHSVIILHFTFHSIVEVNISFTYEAAGTMCWLTLPRERCDGGEGEGDRREPSEHQQAGQTALLRCEVGWENHPCVCGVARDGDGAKRDFWNLCIRSVHFMISSIQNEDRSSE